MPKFHVSGAVTGGKYLGEVEAATKEEAEKLAWKELDCSISLCHQCSSQGEYEIEELVIEEAPEGEAGS